MAAQVSLAFKKLPDGEFNSPLKNQAAMRPN